MWQSNVGEEILEEFADRTRATVRHREVFGWFMTNTGWWSKPLIASPPCFRGETSKQSKLTDAAVSEIRSSGEAGRALARRFGVSPRLIRLVRQGRSWSHV